MGLTASWVVLGAAHLVFAAPTGPAAPAPVPTTLFGVPIPPLPYWSPQQVLVLPSSADPINMQQLMQILGNPASRQCGPQEVAPGQYVKLDCRPYAQVLSAVHDVFDPAKLALLAQGQLHVTPQTPAPPPSNGQNTPEGLPQAIDHRSMQLEGPVKDQGLVGDCSAFSLSSVIDNAILRMHKSDVVSPEHIWAHYGSSDMGSAGDSNVNKPITVNQIWPYSAKQACELDRDSTDECGRLLGVTPNSAASDATLQAQYQRAEASGYYRVTTIERLGQRGNINVDALAALLATGADVWCGFDVDAASWKNTGQVNNVIRDWSATNAGHAVALAGYRPTPGGTGRQFLVHNSWGGAWGDHGFAWVNEAMVRQHMQVAYKVTVIDPRNPTVGVQTDDQCPSGWLVDSSTGQCAQVCPGGSRRAAGQCTARR
jgi:hypothetical protein